MLSSLLTSSLGGPSHTSSSASFNQSTPIVVVVAPAPLCTVLPLLPRILVFSSSLTVPFPNSNDFANCNSSFNYRDIDKCS